MDSIQALVRYQNDGGRAEDVDTAILSTQWLRTCAGLEYFVFLRTLTLSSNQLTELAPLASLTRLEHLELDQNQISDISPLAGLPLTFLHIAQNQVSDISPLASMSRLQWLSLAENRVRSLKPLCNVKSLVQLYVQRNEIRDVGELLYVPQDNLQYVCLCDYVGKANPVCFVPFYRLKLIRLFPGLAFLDYYNEKLEVSPLERTRAANLPWTPALYQLE